MPLRFSQLPRFYELRQEACQAQRLWQASKGLCDLDRLCELNCRRSTAASGGTNSLAVLVLKFKKVLNGAVLRRSCLDVTGSSWCQLGALFSA